MNISPERPRSSTPPPRRPLSTRVEPSKAEMPDPPRHRRPAVPIRRSVTNDFSVCLECGWKLMTLNRHLWADHASTPEVVSGEVGPRPRLSDGGARLRREAAG